MPNKTLKPKSDKGSTRTENHRPNSFNYCCKNLEINSYTAFKEKKKNARCLAGTVSRACDS